MSSLAIKVENLSKQYRIGTRDAYGTFRETLTNLTKAFSRRLKNLGRATPKEDIIWALRDVSFEVKKGDVLGIIGRNGAGKTTLLKIFSRITEPTKGRVIMKGRVASLLEVGTGFHPELTGKENIYLNGAILGMKRHEINKKFDEIVAFAEVEKFLDTPVKRYSSGMYMRLAFAVAAHLEPEILLVDEVLAVGDAAFQKKCLGKMGDVAKEGRTVLFVSHSMQAVTSLCSRTILLSNGHLLMDGITDEVVTHYQVQSFAKSEDEIRLQPEGKTKGIKAYFSSIKITPFSQAGQPLQLLCTGCDLAIETKIECLSDIQEANVALTIYDATGYRLIDINTAQQGIFLNTKAGKQAIAKFLVRELLLKPGTYFLGLWLGRGGFENIDFIEHATKIDVVSSTENAKHVEVFPGPYLCKFENSITIQ
ncbi:MAG: ABC transporter ATP-binding protein [bacterium]